VQTTAETPIDAAAEPVVIETASGRVFAGRFDGSTNRWQLVLRVGARDMYLLRSIRWGDVVRVRIAGKAITPQTLVSRFESEGWPTPIDDTPAPGGPAPSPPQPQPPGPTPQLPAPSDAFDSTAPATGYPARHSLVAWQPARALHIEASVGKWRSYADNDGIVVRVFPVDAEGGIVPVGGMLEVDLIGSNTASLTRGDPFPPLARWVQRVYPEDVDADGATYRFRFGASHPDFDLQVGSIGIVHARLSVPGQGVFDDTADMVWIRPYSATRDRLQIHTGGRFFPQERTSRGMNDSRTGIMPGP
jgi:hypothetical protein